VGTFKVAFALKLAFELALKLALVFVEDILM
jgi:hypothetical protein